MSTEESFHERQTQEVEVLRAIYDKDFTDLRSNDVWKVERPPEFSIKLVPNHDSRGAEEKPEECWALLHVKLSPTYPDTVPEELGVEKAKDVADTNLAELNGQLARLAASLVGEVMITEVAQLVGEWLSTHQRNQGPRFESFYDEMKDRERATEEKKEKERARRSMQRDRERDVVREEVAQRKEEWKEWKKEEESRRRGKHQSGDEAAHSPANSQEGAGFVAYRKRSLSSKDRTLSSNKSISESSEHFFLPVEKGNIEELQFVFKNEKNKVKKTACLGRNAFGGTVFLGVSEANGKMLAVSEWSFKTQRSKKASDERLYDAAALIKQISPIEQELASMQKLDHPNVIKYLALSQQKTPSTFRLHVFEEFVRGSNLSFYLTENIHVELDLLRHFTTGILEALSFMHKHNFVHRDLRDTSVFIESSGMVRVGDFSIAKRVRDLSQQDNDCPEDDRFPVAIGRGGKKVDIYRLGLLALSLATGEIAQSPDIPSNMFPSDFVNFLKRCLDRDERERSTSQDLLEHRWIKQRFEKSPSLLLKGPRNGGAGATNRDEGASSPEGEEDPIAVPFMQVGTGQSRLQGEFSYISDIGKGGFGEVMKVKNNLDGQIYAIKKIKLNPKNKTVTRKIMREVKLLSRLNHENVVRYYTSWIEVTTITEDHKETETSFDDDSSMMPPPKTPVSLLKKNKKSLMDSFGMPSPRFPAAVEEDTADRNNVSYSSHFLPYEDSSSSSGDEGDEDEDVFGTSILPKPGASSFFTGPDSDDDDDIVFERGEDESERRYVADDGDDEDEEDDEEDISSIEEYTSEANSSMGNKIEIRLMYIQMEYCDKQTLRNAMDGGLHKDSKRLWRMFREICEGLVHIHTQGMIHRDLKPVNIFIDSQDHVKIGDFGLATTSVIGAKELRESLCNESIDNEGSDLTGQIGTALYVAPEINSGRTGHYSQKVDIYSLGVIFFEMCYPPLQTGMERIKILTALRSPSTTLPSDFDESLMMQQTYLLRLLLDHDPSKRPNSQELLQSDYLPPPQVEEAELKEMVRHTLANSTGKAYRHLIDSCISQKMKLSQDIFYDSDISRSTTSKSLKRSLLGQEHVRTVMENVFRRHGGVNIDMSHLLPKGENELYDRPRAPLVEVMTRSGAVVRLPYDLRVSFARFLARSQINQIKRYSIAPVFREVRLFGCHPREEIECAFDIVTPSEGSLLADAEVLYIADELLREFPAITEASYYIRLNHTGLLKGILANCGVADEFVTEIYHVIREGERWSRQQRNSHLVGLGMSEQVVNQVFSLLEHEGPVNQIQSLLRHMVRRKTPASQEMKRALGDLETIISNAKALGIRCNLVIAPSFVYNPGHFNGMICQLVRRKRKKIEIMAAGGRYDQLVQRFADNFSLGIQSEFQKDLNQSAVGISLSMEHLVSAAFSSDSEELQFRAIEVAVYSQSHLPSVLKEKAKLASKLWSMGIKCLICDVFHSLDEAQGNAAELGASFIVILRELDTSARIRCLLDKERFQEKKLALADLSDFLLKQLRPEATEATSGPSGNLPLARMESTTKPLPEVASSKTLNVQVNYIFKFYKKNSQAVSKKRLESTVSSKLTTALTMFAPNSLIEVIVLMMPKTVLKSMAALLDFESESVFAKSVGAVIETHVRFRKELVNVCDEIQSLKFEMSRNIFVLYSVDDHDFQFLVTP